MDRSKFNKPYREWCERATQRAKKALRPGQRITRKLCGGRYGTFKFDRWDGEWACGTTVSDAHATNITKVDGQPVDFSAGEPRPHFMNARGEVI